MPYRGSRSPHSGRIFPDGRLDVVGSVVAPIHNQEVLDAADDEQVVTETKPGIPGSQPRCPLMGDNWRQTCACLSACATKPDATLPPCTQISPTDPCGHSIHVSGSTMRTCCDRRRRSDQCAASAGTIAWPAGSLGFATISGGSFTLRGRYVQSRCFRHAIRGPRRGKIKAAEPFINRLSGRRTTAAVEDGAHVPARSVRVHRRSTTHRHSKAKLVLPKSCDRHASSCTHRAGR